MIIVGKKIMIRFKFKIGINSIVAAFGKQNSIR